ncbi:Inner membrane protein YohK [Hartmannibacter diazotrophicus]|uniref:Inner membrane protein YohK n=1 Tax=Hartmannibacter diazotrophicus TaxID=1482074 RepID=A0A2C9CZY1_9HYPH|nr:LrgB family protein [Hartmannibacter diazotrophicus]SON53556.1 Inner membrane protein YohK [Hartmannibacter diazotrophicus]
MTTSDFSLWAYLSGTPLLWLTLTLVAYALADAFSKRTRRHPLANPVLHSVWVIGLVLVVSKTPYRDYFDGAQFIHFLLGPATVALAVPLYRNRQIVVRSLVPMVAALVAGSAAAIVSVVWLGELASLPRLVLLSIAPKSVTAGVSMGISQSLGGDVSLTAVTTIATGVIGAIVVTPLMNALGMKDWRARGFAAGLAAHGIGTARALQVHPLAGTFSGIAMGLNAAVTAFLVPLLVQYLL